MLSHIIIQFLLPDVISGRIKWSWHRCHLISTRVRNVLVLIIGNEIIRRLIALQQRDLSPGLLDLFPARAVTDA